MKAILSILLLTTLLSAEDDLSTFQEIEQQNSRFYKSIDTIEDEDAKNTVEKKIKGLFGLKPYNDNYLLPFGYREGTYTSYTPSDEYRNIEAEMQLSLSYDVYADLVGLNETYTFAYTQKSMWQIYTESGPFRETNYNPEFIISIPIYHSSEFLSLKMLRLTASHQSNGQGNITAADINVTIDESDSIFEPTWIQNRSRSWNYLSATLVMQHKSLFLGIRSWYRLPEDPLTDDNPDFIDYYGQGELFLIHPYGKALAKFTIRHNFETAKGAMEASVSYPFARQDNVYWFAKVFSGYGETMIDYNNYITKFSIGFSFSR